MWFCLAEFKSYAVVHQLLPSFQALISLYGQLFWLTWSGVKSKAQRKTWKSRQFVPIFDWTNLVPWKRIFWPFLGRWPLENTSKLKRVILIQIDIFKSEASPLSNHRKYWLLKIFKFVLHVTVALDQRKQKLPNFLNFGFKSKLE